MARGVRTRIVGVTTDAGARVLHGLEGWVLRYSEVETTPFLAVDQFGWVAPLEAGFPLIRKELDAVLEYREDLPNFQDISTDQLSITDDDRWKTFFFMAYGFRSDANCARCPQTTRLLDAVPGLTTAFFSILSPGKHIPPHRGPWRGVLRYHLALKIPEPGDLCGISVGGQVAHWVEGESMVFDDGYEHSAWNDSDDIRVVLFVDVVRPLRSPAATANRVLIKAISSSPFVRDGKSRHLDWERRFEALQNRS